MSLLMPGYRYRLQGFTLLEVLVAFVILSLSLGVIYQVFGQGLKASSQSEHYTRATLLAQSLMAETGITEPLQSGIRSGRSEKGYSWEVVTSAFGVRPVEDDSMPAAYQVTVNVGWEGSPQAIRLSSIRLDK